MCWKRCAASIDAARVEVCQGWWAIRATCDRSSSDPIGIAIPAYQVVAAA
jgi:hypothetical protein